MIIKLINRKLLAISIITGIAGLGLSTQASASLIGFQTEVNTGSKFAIRNTSSDGILIQSVSVTLGDNTLFDTAGSGVDPILALNTGISIAHFDDSDPLSVLRDATGSGTLYDVTSTWNTSTGGSTGYSGVLSTDVMDNAIDATFNFNDFNPNEAWGFDIDYDTRDGDEEATGADMNNALVEVTFLDSTTGLSYMLESQYGTFSGNKRSFPTDFLDADGNNVGPTETVSTVPVPAAAWLFGSGLIGLVGIARRKNSN